MGSILAEDVTSPEDFPPFRASVMDGFALSESGKSVYKIVCKQSLAGQAPPKITDVSSTAVYITTGAPVPDGFKSVVPIEKTEVNQDCLSIKMNTTEG
mgnify:CR=1 FL=1